MNLRILLFYVLVFASLGSIESKRPAGSRDGSKPSGSSRKPSGGGSSSSRGKGGSSKPTNTSKTHAEASHDFLKNEGGGSKRPHENGGSSGSNRRTSTTRPFSTVPAPEVTKRPPTQNYNHTITKRPPLNTGRFNSSTKQPAYNPYFNTSTSRLPTNQGRLTTQRPPVTRPPNGNFNSTRQPPFNPDFNNSGQLPPNQGPHQLPPAYPGSTVHYPQPPSTYPHISHPMGIYGSHVDGFYGQTPGTTVVVVPGQPSSGSSTGHIFEEAVIRASVNAAVWKLAHPNYHHDNFGHHSYIPLSQTIPAQPNTQIITNNYYNQVPVSPAAAHEARANNSQTGGISPGSKANYNSGSSRTTAKAGSKVNPKPTPDPNEFLWEITEKLFDLDENNAFKFITIHMQKVSTLNLTNLSTIPDSADQPLLTVDPEAYTIPTIGAAHALYKASIEENATTATDRRKEESLLIDLIMQTNVMAAAMDFLATNDYVGKEYFDQKDSLKRLWFTPYDGSSSGFKRVFEGQVIGAGFMGIQDWMAFDVQEKAKRANYLGFIERLDLGGKAAIIKLDFKINEILKPGTTIFIGTSPELEMALYTICYYTRPNDYCVVSLGGTKFSIYTHNYRYFGKDLIDLAVPIIPSKSKL